VYGPVAELEVEAHAVHANFWTVPGDDDHA
jgi:hypothetical protein